MLVSVLMVTGFVVAVLAILGLTPALERWATAPPVPVVPDGMPETSSSGAKLP
jgi:hypothetical protein